MANRLKLAVVGDVHGYWTRDDVRFFDESDYAAVLFVGDVTSLRRGAGLRVAREIGELSVPALVIPGNHDAVTIGQFSAEILGAPPIVPFGVWRLRRRVEALRRALAPAILCGFSRHRIEQNGRALGVIAARPHAMGGRLSFAPYLRDQFDVATLAQSADRLCQLIDDAPETDLMFLAHNGPHGLGGESTDPWGVDFKRGGGDFGDPDLQKAIEHAKTVGKNVVAVVAGHMHHPNRQRAERRWHVELDGVHYVNAARVPRIRGRRGPRRHHHIALELDDDRCTVTEIMRPLTEEVA